MSGKTSTESYRKRDKKFYDMVAMKARKPFGAMLDAAIASTGENLSRSAFCIRVMMEEFRRRGIDPETFVPPPQTEEPADQTEE